VIKAKKNMPGRKLRIHGLAFVLCLVFVFSVAGASRSAVQTPDESSPPEIKVVYPKEGQQIAAVDSTFILGSVTPGTRLRINGVEVDVYHTGGFLAYLAIDTGDFAFCIEAANAAGTSTLDWPVVVGRPELFVCDSVMTILPQTIQPAGHQVLFAGDYLQVSFRGTPGCGGHFCVDGVDGTFPMAEREIGGRLFQGGDVFGEDGASAKLEPPGLYTGVWQVPVGLRLDSARVLFYSVKTALLRSSNLPVYIPESGRCRWDSGLIRRGFCSACLGIRLSSIHS